MEWVFVKPSVCCFICRKRQHAEEERVQFDWLPKGWRRVRRGFAGRVCICDDCNRAGRKHQRDIVGVSAMVEG